MPLTTTTQETQKIIGGTQCLSRHYPNGCPHKEGTEILLAFERPDKRMQPYARARVMAISSVPMSMRSDGQLANTLANGEGFASADAWKEHFSGMYGPVSKESEVTRLQLTVKLLDGVEQQQPPQQQQKPPSEDEIPNVSQVQIQTKTETKTVGSVDSLEAVAELESKMFGG